MRYTLRFLDAGRVHYAQSEYYSTLVMLGQSLYDCSDAASEIQIWQGNTLLWENNVPKQFSA